MKNLILRGLALRREATKGFTLIELLIVIALIGILAVALLSAINPLEQMRKGRDSTRKADAGELLNAIERFNASYQCFPWNFDLATNTCAAVPTALATSVVNAVIFGAGGNLQDLLTVDELKTEFSSRVTLGTGPSMNKLFITEVTLGGVEGIVKVCFEVESESAKRGGLGALVGDITTDPGGAPPSPCNAYTGGTAYASTNCNMCVPQ